MTKQISTSIQHIRKKHPDSLVVTLESRGNPDFNQNPDMPISPTSMRPCDTFAEASKLCRAYIGTYGLGGGNWTGGKVYHPVKGLIALVSYNGRVWKSTTGKWIPDQKEITDLNTNDY